MIIRSSRELFAVQDVISVELSSYAFTVKSSFKPQNVVSSVTVRDGSTTVPASDFSLSYSVENDNMINVSAQKADENTIIIVVLIKPGLTGSEKIDLKIGYNGETYDKTISVTVVKDGSDGIDGDAGPIAYPVGTWNSGTTYTKDDILAPYVEYKGEYWILVADSDKGTEPTAANDNVWRKMTKLEYLFTKIFFTKFGRLASAVFSGDYMYSAKGMQNGSLNENYQNFTGPNGAWMPRFLVNLLTGETWMGNAHVNGEINATSGSFTNVKIDGCFGAQFSDLINFVDFPGTFDEWEQANLKRLQEHDNSILYNGDKTYRLSASTRDSGRVIRLFAKVNNVVITASDTNKFLYGGVLISSLTIKRGYMATLVGIGTAAAFDYYLVTGITTARPQTVQDSVAGFNDKFVIRGRVTVKDGAISSVIYNAPVKNLTVTRQQTGVYNISWTSSFFTGIGEKMACQVTAIDSPAYGSVNITDSKHITVRMGVYNGLVDCGFCFEIKAIEDYIY